jgi:hypothetical protein
MDARYKGVCQAERGRHIRFEEALVGGGESGLPLQVRDHVADLLDVATFDCADIDVEYDDEHVAVTLTRRADLERKHAAAIKHAAVDEPREE